MTFTDLYHTKAAPVYVCTHTAENRKILPKCSVFASEKTNFRWQTGRVVGGGAKQEGPCALKSRALRITAGGMAQCGVHLFLVGRLLPLLLRLLPVDCLAFCPQLIGGRHLGVLFLHDGFIPGQPTKVGTTHNTQTRVQLSSYVVIYLPLHHQD